MVKVAGSDLGAIRLYYIGRCGNDHGDTGGDLKAVGATDCDIQDCGDDDEDEEADHGEANGGAYLPCNSVVLVALVPEDGEGAHDNCSASDNVEQHKPQRTHVGEHLVGNAILDCDVKRHEKNGDTREEEAEEYNNLGEPRDNLVFGVLHVDHEHNDAEEKEQSDDDAHCDYDSVDGHGEVQGGEGGGAS